MIGKSARLGVNRAQQRVTSMAAGLALSLTLVKWGVTRRLHGTPIETEVR